ncbi:MAG: adenosylcobinamide-phosphate synthase CbiB [Desulfuromonas sp.]|nr:adenosylcobinamide-phosphate synthase CbiB [Desulfuromonas sp.]
MIPLPIQILLAIVIDAVAGDPRWMPHPVQGIAALATRLEAPLRRTIGSARVAGVITLLSVLCVTAGVSTILLWAGKSIHPLLGDGVAIALLYTTIATRSLTQHARQVQQPLEQHDLATARQHVAWLVGRDTDQLDEAEITRATVESVAENSVDGVTAPLLFAVVAGPVGAMLYKAINTLDSTFGYKNARYLEFGWASARLDDVANFIPARFTALLVPLAAKIIGLDARQAWAMWRRDRHQHPSPNGGQTEAAMAGALNVRLGGENSYFGVPAFRPYMGEAQQTLCARHIDEVIHLMWFTSVLVISIALAGWLVVTTQ